MLNIINLLLFATSFLPSLVIAIGTQPKPRCNPLLLQETGPEDLQKALSHSLHSILQFAPAPAEKEMPHKPWRPVYQTTTLKAPPSKPHYQGSYRLAPYTFEELIRFVEKDGILNPQTKQITPFQKLEIQISTEPPNTQALEIARRFTRENNHPYGISPAGKGAGFQTFYIHPQEKPQTSASFIAKFIDFAKLQKQYNPKKGFVLQVEPPTHPPMDGNLKLWLFSYSLARFFKTKATFENGGPLYRILELFSSLEDLQNGFIIQKAGHGIPIYTSYILSRQNPQNFLKNYGISESKHHLMIEAIEQFMSDIHEDVLRAHEHFGFGSMRNVMEHNLDDQGNKLYHPVSLDWNHGSNALIPKLEYLQKDQIPGIPYFFDF